MTSSPSEPERIRDLEREVAGWREEEAKQRPLLEGVSRQVHKLMAENIRLEREVERLKPFEAKAERWFAEIEQREADRADAEKWRARSDYAEVVDFTPVTKKMQEYKADAERFRWLAIECDDVNGLICETGNLDEVRAVVDAAMAKDSQP